jgi:predicted secreted protein
MLKRSAILFLMILVAQAAFAGDVATFVNLGFSDDGAFFMFGQYGIDQPSGASYAEIYAVNNASNDFAPQGVLKASNSAPLDIGQDGSGLFYNLMYQNAANAKKYRVDHLKQGRLLYVLLDGEEPLSDLSFRDFKTGADYEITLNKDIMETGSGVVSSFSLDLAVSYSDGGSKRVLAGNPAVRRSGVRDYLIRRVILSPDSRYAIVIVEKKTNAPDGVSVRYMVEPIRLK